MGVKRSRSEHQRQQARRFFEGCCNSTDLEQLSMKERMAVAAELGYHTVIFSKFYGMEALTKKDRCDLPDVASLVAATKPQSQKEREAAPRLPLQRSRITIELGDVDGAHATLTDLKSTLDTYDLIAVAPTTGKAFQYACSTMDVDVIAFSPEAMQSRLKFQLNHSLMDKARARGVVFEIPYSAMLTDNASKRQHVISNANALVQGAGAGKGIVVSGQPETAFQLRGAHDVANMATFFGMSEEGALDALSTRWEGLLGRRKQAKSFKGMTLSRGTGLV